MPAAVSRHRVFLLATSAALYPAILGTFLLAERPGLGIGHFYYFPVAMVALASGPVWGILAGIAATGCYTLGIVINPHLPASDVLTASTSIRFVTFTTIGALVGWYAHNNRQLSDRLRVAEERDFLTGLLNTRAFDAALSARAELGKPFGLILADMDSLKEVNDREGHAVGNDLLRRAADLLSRKLDYGDQVARVGGDEFGIITSAPGTDAVRALCGRLTAMLHEQGLSMSFGWAVCPRDGDSALLLYRAADERLYAQKLIRSRLSEGEVVGLPSQAERLMLRARRGA
ncbi:MAG: diguanylate cyclase [Actinobacteria bacterium]|nr:MAG: diguanylate cyclase [Actinomycetota bacterium]